MDCYYIITMPDLSYIDIDAYVYTVIKGAGAKK